jgi:hypothetical protein
LTPKLRGILHLLTLILASVVAPVATGAAAVLTYKTLQLQTQIQELQNYPPKILAYPNDQYQLLCNLNKPSGMMHLFVMILTPHSGYAVVNQTFFQLSFYSKDVLDQRSDLLKSDNVTIYREPVFAVAAGSFQTTLEITFVCWITLAFQYIQPGRAVEAPIGTVGIRVTFYDVQADRTYTTDTTAMVWVTYDTTGLLHSSP